MIRSSHRYLVRLFPALALCAALIVPHAAAGHAAAADSDLAPYLDAHINWRQFAGHRPGDEQCDRRLIPPSHGAVLPRREDDHIAPRNSPIRKASKKSNAEIAKVVSRSN